MTRICGRCQGQYEGSPHRRACNRCESAVAPLIQKALTAVANAKREGRLPDLEMMLCADCGRTAQQYDHRDYSKPLEVDAVCRSCNRKRGPAVQFLRAA